jgi:hypothetical protein
MPAYVRIRQQYVSNTSARPVRMEQDECHQVSIRQHTSAYVSIRQRKNLWGWSKMNATQARQLSELPQSHRHLRIHVVHRTLHTHIKTHSNSHTTHPRTYTKYVHSRDATGPRQATRTTIHSAHKHTQPTKAATRRQHGKQGNLCPQRKSAQNISGLLDLR